MSSLKMSLKMNIKKLIEQNDLESAKTFLQKYSSDYVEDVEIHCFQGIIAMMENRLDDANHSFLEGQKLDKNHVDILYNLGYLCQVQKQDSKAKAYYEEALNVCEDEALRTELLTLNQELSDKLLATSFDYGAYWNKRLNMKFDIEGVGYIGLGKTYNESLYKNRIDILAYILKNVMPDLGSKKVLELGPGIGIYTKFFQDNFVKNYKGIDISKKSVQVLSELYQDYHFVNGNISDPRLFENSQVDLIFAADVLLHVTNEVDYTEVLKNISKSLKEDAYVILFDPISFIGTKSSSSHLKIRDYKDVESKLFDNGLKLHSVMASTLFMNNPFDGKILQNNSGILEKLFEIITLIFSDHSLSEHNKKILANWLLYMDRELLTQYGIGFSQKVLVMTKLDFKPESVPFLSIKNVFTMDEVLDLQEKYYCQIDQDIKSSDMFKLLEKLLKALRLSLNYSLT